MTSVPGYFLMKSASSLVRTVFFLFVIAGFPIPWTGSPPSYRHATARGNALLQKKKLNPAHALSMAANLCSIPATV
jgi:hypothetical protein